jgi:hypothetical protein
MIVRCESLLRSVVAMTGVHRFNDFDAPAAAGRCALPGLWNGVGLAVTEGSGHKGQPKEAWPGHGEHRLGTRNAGRQNKKEGPWKSRLGRG